MAEDARADHDTQSSANVSDIIFLLRELFVLILLLLNSIYICTRIILYDTVCLP